MLLCCGTDCCRRNGTGECSRHAAEGMLFLDIKNIMFLVSLRNPTPDNEVTRVTFNLELKIDQFLSSRKCLSISCDYYLTLFVHVTESAGVGIFLLLRSTQLLLVRNNRTCMGLSLYLDIHGEVRTFCLCSRM